MLICRQSAMLFVGLAQPTYFTHGASNPSVTIATLETMSVSPDSSRPRIASRSFSDVEPSRCSIQSMPAALNLRTMSSECLTVHAKMSNRRPSACFTHSFTTSPQTFIISDSSSSIL